MSICLGCHSDIDELRKKPAHHQPAFEQGCSTCHTPHGGDNDHLLRAKGNALCLECHGPDSQPQRDEANHLLTIFNGKVRLPEDYYQKNKVPILPLRFGLGHPVEYHPVSDVMDPTDQTQGEDAAELPLVPSAACFGAAGSAGQRPGEQHGVLR